MSPNSTVSSDRLWLRTSLEARLHDTHTCTWQHEGPKRMKTAWPTCLNSYTSTQNDAIPLIFTCFNRMFKQNSCARSRNELQMTRYIHRVAAARPSHRRQVPWHTTSLDTGLLSAASKLLSGSWRTRCRFRRRTEPSEASVRCLKALFTSAARCFGHSKKRPNEPGSGKLPGRNRHRHSTSHFSISLVPWLGKGLGI